MTEDGVMPLSMWARWRLRRARKLVLAIAVAGCLACATGLAWDFRQGQGDPDAARHVAVNATDSARAVAIIELLRGVRESIATLQAVASESGPPGDQARAAIAQIRKQLDR